MFIDVFALGMDEVVSLCFESGFKQRKMHVGAG
jgi:hypothetical protein